MDEKGQGIMDSQESILADIQQIEGQMKALAKQREALMSRLDTLYYVVNMHLVDTPIIICHGTEAHCRQYMLEHHPLGEWYHGTTQFAPTHNPERINWAILYSITKAEKRDWARVQAYIESPSQDTEWGIIAMLHG